MDSNHLSGEFPNSITNLVNLFTFTFDCWITSTDPDVINFVDALAPGWQNNICPVVLSITRGNPNPTTSPSVNFTVTFSESVTGVDVSDYALSTTGVSGAVVTGVTGSGSVYTATVNTGSGSGAIRLDVIDNDSIVNAALNPLGGPGEINGNFTGGDAYVVIKGLIMFLPLILH